MRDSAYCREQADETGSPSSICDTADCSASETAEEERPAVAGRVGRYRRCAVYSSRSLRTSSAP